LWFHAKKACAELKYNVENFTHAKTLRNLTDYVKTYSDVIENLRYVPPVHTLHSNKNASSPSTSHHTIQLHTKFINQTGLLKLISISKLTFAKKLMEFISNDVLPQILTTGKYIPKTLTSIAVNHSNENGDMVKTMSDFMLEIRRYQNEMKRRDIDHQNEMTEYRNEMKRRDEEAVIRERRMIQEITEHFNEKFGSLMTAVVAAQPEDLDLQHQVLVNQLVGFIAPKPPFPIHWRVNSYRLPGVNLRRLNRPNVDCAAIRLKSVNYRIRRTRLPIL
jgi:prophage antirepressor-like protein